MKNNKNLHITLISFIIGFMLAVQYNTMQNPKERDTRDIWEIRQALSEEKKRHSELLTNIQGMNEVIRKYEDVNSSDPELVLRETVLDLHRQIGLSPVTGPGLTLTIKPAKELIEYGYDIDAISPELLFRLVNDIYRNGGQYVEIDGQRLLHTSAIRDINGATTINSVPISKVDVEVKIIMPSEELAQKLYNYLLSSSLMDEFYIDNLELVVGDVKSFIQIKNIATQITKSHLSEAKKGD
ncbi:DUF881 domain-containing protein [Metasolibacillus meyeri]|uniref:DUF881 domain-containing protein n=1 Tax=Metasolibacillus meyeri TaxID=1071052 RepID=A0AAW9NTH4_9BACL|nr:DUF881 domain-containing protein [Metasolibacillus meyeri]MEC1179443.1 DUF881 domain-containing protein [Metasolibacillus meyeri]